MTHRSSLWNMAPNDMSHVCAVPAKAYSSMTWLDRVEGCACCLANTANVSPCYLAAKGCVDEDTLQGCCQADFVQSPQQFNVIPLSYCFGRAAAYLPDASVPAMAVVGLPQPMLAELHLQEFHGSIVMLWHCDVLPGSVYKPAARLLHWNADRLARQAG